MIYSASGCQKGDPFGQAILRLALHPISTHLETKFNVWYLDNEAVGGDQCTVLKTYL